MIYRQRFDTSINQNNSGYTLGQRVHHPKFGEGTIINLEWNGNLRHLQIAFKNQGIKWIVAAYAKLE